MRVRLGKNRPVWLVGACLSVEGAIFGLDFVWNSGRPLAVVDVITYYVAGLSLGVMVVVRPPRTSVATRLLVIAACVAVSFSTVALVKVFTATGLEYFDWSAMGSSFAAGCVVLAFASRRPRRQWALRVAVLSGVTAVTVSAVSVAGGAGDGRGPLVLDIIEHPLYSAALAFAIAASSF